MGAPAAHRWGNLREAPRRLRARLGRAPERAKARLEADIGKLVRQGLSREEAVKRLYRKLKR